MGEYCASPEGNSALAAAGLTLPTQPTAAADRPRYGSCDRRYGKQVFDNLHGSILLDPVRSSSASSLPAPSLLIARGLIDDPLASSFAVRVETDRWMMRSLLLFVGCI